MFRGLHPIVLTAGVALGASLTQFQPFSPRRVFAGDKREARPIATDLVTAIRDADVQVVRKLIDDGADVDARDAEGNTPLILASFYASPKCVEVMHEKGADANAANRAGVTATPPRRDEPGKNPVARGRRREGPGANG